MKRTKEQKQNVEKLITFLQKLPDEKFNFSNLVTEYTGVDDHRCGTVCCAYGWFPEIFPKDFKWAAFGSRCVVTTAGVSPEALMRGQLVGLAEVRAYQLFGFDPVVFAQIFHNGYEDDAYWWYLVGNSDVTKEMVIDALTEANTAETYEG